jgi:hypothetical protein
VIDSIKNIIEKYISQIKENKIIIKEKTIELGMIVIFNTTIEGSNEASSLKNNKFKKSFEEDSKQNRLTDAFRFLSSLQCTSPIQKNIMNYISISICELFRNDKPPEYYNDILSYIDKLRKSPPPTSGYNFPEAAQSVWNGIVKKCVIY